MSPPPLSRSVGWIVDCGSDFPDQARETIKHWDTSCLLRETPHRLTTRGWNGYGDNEHRGKITIFPPHRNLLSFHPSRAPSPTSGARAPRRPQETTTSTMPVFLSFSIFSGLFFDIQSVLVVDVSVYFLHLIPVLSGTRPYSLSLCSLKPKRFTPPSYGAFPVHSCYVTMFLIALTFFIQLSNT